MIFCVCLQIFYGLGQCLKLVLEGNNEFILVSEHFVAILKSVLISSFDQDLVISEGLVVGLHFVGNDSEVGGEPVLGNGDNVYEMNFFSFGGSGGGGGHSSIMEG